MKSLLHAPGIRQQLRRLRPYYNSIFRRQKDISKLPTPAEHINAMGGRGVFLLSFGRCGTTVFCEFLASHPGLTTFGEVLNEDSYYSFFHAFSKRALRWWTMTPSLMEAEFYRFIEKLVARNPKQHCLLDMKIESLHLIEGNWRLPGKHFKIFDALKQSNAPIILMERRDLVARHVSGRVALHRGQYHSFQKAQEIEPFAIDIAAMEADNEIVRAEIEYITTLFQDYPRFKHLVYEELFAEDGSFAPQLGVDMAELLGVENLFEHRPQLEKVSRGKSSDLITNWDEVEAARARQNIAL